MKAALTAGSTFAVMVLAGFAGGLALAHRTGTALWAVAGLFAGVLLVGWSQPARFFRRENRPR